MQKYQCVRLTNKLYNLTSDPLFFYEESSGSIAELPPMLSLCCSPDENKTISYYVVTKEMFDTLDCPHSYLKLFAIIKNQAYGRDGVKISYLVWAKDTSIHIRLHRNAGNVSSRYR